MNQVFVTDNVDKQVDIFTAVFTECLDLCATQTTKQVNRPFTPWITEELKILMCQRNYAQKLLKYDGGNTTLHNNYKQLKKQVKAALNCAKVNFYNEWFENSKGDSGTTWKILRELKPDTKKKNSVLSDQEDCDNDGKIIVEDFNRFFVSVGKNTFEKSQQNYDNTGEKLQPIPVNYNALIDTFRPKPVSEADLILAIKHMKNTNSYGCDGIPLRFLRDSLPITITYLTCIMNTSIVTGIFPKQWKHSIIVPIHKTGNVKEPNNYRPISLLPIVSKLLEKIIASQLCEFLESNHLLSVTQHGFRHNLSTNTALLSLSSTLYHNMDQRKVSLITLCDLSKAFDSVSHDRLIDKCVKLHIDSFWFQSYLTKRTYRK